MMYIFALTLIQYLKNISFIDKLRTSLRLFLYIASNLAESRLK